MNNPPKPVFLRRFILESNSANNISEKVLKDLDKFEIVVFGGITDNVRCMVATIQLFFSKRPIFMPLRCAVHVVNLIIKSLNNIFMNLTKLF